MGEFGEGSDMTVVNEKEALGTLGSGSCGTEICRRRLTSASKALFFSRAKKKVVG